MNAIVRLLAVYAGLSLLLCAMTRMEWSPLQPNGWGQWLAFLLLIIPAAAAVAGAEFLGERRLGRRGAIKSDESTTHVDCSWARLATGVFVLLVTVCVVLSAAWWLSHPAASI